MTQFPQQEAVGEDLQTGGGDGTVIVNPATCGCRINKEGKDPMSVDHYKKLCGWLLDWNTSDGVFGHCFLVLTWNLSCCTHNTANIWFCEIEWGSTFDVFEIYFAHMKMDQTGMRQNTLITCMLTLAVLLSVLCFHWHFIFPVVVTYHRVGSPGCSQDRMSIKGFRRCYLISFGIMRQRCLNWGSIPK